MRVTIVRADELAAGSLAEAARPEASVPTAGSLAEDARNKAFAELDGRPRGRVLVGMSGGVDSSSAAALLLEAGFDCVGATMRLYDQVLPGTKTCCSLSDIMDARVLCASLGIPHETIDARDEFERRVIGRFVASYEAGETPNPCVTCNRWLKFGLFAAYARELGCDYIATGHYARVAAHEGRMRLMRAAHLEKDQSYVLHPVSREQIDHLLLPLGRLKKDEVRAYAEQRGFVSAHKSDSQDICFVPDGDYAGFLEKRHGGGFEPGPIVSTRGELLGEHTGLPRYTIGQRKGLGVAAGRRLYVVEKNAERNSVVLGDASELKRSTLAVGDVIWHEDPRDGMEAEACLRYQGKAYSVTIELRAGELLVRAMGEPFDTVAPGQSCVFYRGDLLLGGGTILS